MKTTRKLLLPLLSLLLCAAAGSAVFAADIEGGTSEGYVIYQDENGHTRKMFVTTDVTDKLKKDDTLKDFFVGEAFMRFDSEYDSSNEKDQINMLRYLLSQFSGYSSSEQYPILPAEYDYASFPCKKSTPEYTLGWISGLFTIDRNALDTFTKNVKDGAYQSQAEIPYTSSLKTTGYSLYLKDGSFVYEYGPSGGIGITDFKVAHAERRGDTYHIKYYWELDMMGDKDNGTGYAVMTKEKVADGTEFWTLVSNSPKGYKDGYLNRFIYKETP